MRILFLPALLLLMTVPAVAAAPGGGDPLGTCDEGNPVGEALDEHAGGCGGSVEPWQCLGGSSGSSTVRVGPYDVVITRCDTGLPDLW